MVTSLEAASTAITDQTVWQLLLIRLTSLSGRSCCSDQDEREENVVRSNPIAADSGRLWTRTSVSRLVMWVSLVAAAQATPSGTQQKKGFRRQIETSGTRQLIRSSYRVHPTHKWSLDVIVNLRPKLIDNSFKFVKHFKGINPHTVLNSGGVEELIRWPEKNGELQVQTGGLVTSNWSGRRIKTCYLPST